MELIKVTMLAVLRIKRYNIEYFNIYCVLIIIILLAVYVFLKIYLFEEYLFYVHMCVRERQREKERAVLHLLTHS